MAGNPMNRAELKRLVREGRTTLSNDGRRRILELADGGLPYSTISRMTGVHPSTVRGIVERGRVDSGREVQCSNPEVLRKDIERLAEKVNKLHALICPNVSVPTNAQDKRNGRGE